MIYFDNAAATQILPQSSNAWLAASEENWFNPSSQYSPARKILNSLDELRSLFLQTAGFSNGQIVFTSGATEANNLAVAGSKKKHNSNEAISFLCEHPSVVEPLSTENFSKVHLLNASKERGINAEDIRPYLSDKVRFVSMMHVNNETGMVNDIAGVGNMLKREFPACVFHVDASQSFLKYEIQADASGIDLLTVSGQKTHAGRGCGALLKVNSAEIQPITKGGGQEYGLRAGTENYPAICSFGAAINYFNNNLKENYRKVSQLKEVLFAALKQNNINFTKFLSDQNHISPWIANFSLDGIMSEVFVRMMGDKEIYAANSSACSSAYRGDRVLKAYKMSDAYIRGAIRISFSIFNTEEEIDSAVKTIKQLIADF